MMYSEVLIYSMRIIFEEELVYFQQLILTTWQDDLNENFQTFVILKKCVPKDMNINGWVPVIWLHSSPLASYQYFL